MDKIQLAQVAYNSYGSVTDYKNFQGNPMPSWEQLPPKIQEAWIAASETCYNAGRIDGISSMQQSIHHNIQTNEGTINIS